MARCHWRDLLNVLLPRERHVRDVAYATTELQGFSPFNKSVRLDLRCTGEDGTEFIVEVQCYRQRNLFRRCILYASQVYASGSRKGDRQEYDIPPVYFICLLSGNALIADRDSPEWQDKFVAEYTFREKDTGEIPDETIFTIFVELNRLGKELEKVAKELKKMGTPVETIISATGLSEEKVERL